MTEQKFYGEIAKMIMEALVNKTQDLNRHIVVVHLPEGRATPSIHAPFYINKRGYSMRGALLRARWAQLTPQTSISSRWPHSKVDGLSSIREPTLTWRITSPDSK